MSQNHIFVHDPRSSHNVCWICGMKKDEHVFAVEHKTIEVNHVKLRVKSKIPGSRKRQKLNVRG
jgi:hypothetical protein